MIPEDRLAGVLLGTALGDALGLPMEGMSPGGVARTFPVIDRYRFLGRTGFVSDDTEQSALVAQSLARHPDDRARCVRAFRWALLGWFGRLPWGIGLGTLRACVKIALGFKTSGVLSAGNGAAMRGAIVGAFWPDPAVRRGWVDAISQVTHLDPRAIEGARFVAEIAALCVASDARSPGKLDADRALAVVEEPALRAALARAIELARGTTDALDAAKTLGNTGYVVHSVPLATFYFFRFGDDPLRALAETIRAGGDTDSNAAIVGAWVGGLHGASGLPPGLIADLGGGPFGASHLRALAADLGRAQAGAPSSTARYSWVGAMARNLALFPVALAQAIRVVFRR